jgi:hypothetical protein
MIARRKQNRRSLDRRRRPGTPENHADCPEYLTSTAFSLGTEVTASPYPPIVHGPYTAPPLICPHGVKFWVEPTGEQIAQWAKDGTA